MKIKKMACLFGNRYRFMFRLCSVYHESRI